MINIVGARPASALAERGYVLPDERQRKPRRRGRSRRSWNAGGDRQAQRWLRSPLYSAGRERQVAEANSRLQDGHTSATRYREGRNIPGETSSRSPIGCC